MKRLLPIFIISALGVTACGKDKIVIVDPFDTGAGVEVNCTKNTYREFNSEYYNEHRTPKEHMRYLEQFGEDSFEASFAPLVDMMGEDIINAACID